MERGIRTLEEWIDLLGQQVRNARIARNIDQRTLAALANVSIAAVSDLERGAGSSVKTLVAVVRALDRTDWLESLAPSATISPLQALRAKRSGPQPRRRVRMPSRT
jgi:transcriptional regulator with XRE-family HTH domain